MNNAMIHGRTHPCKQCLINNVENMKRQWDGMERKKKKKKSSTCRRQFVCVMCGAYVCVVAYTREDVNAYILCAVRPHGNFSVWFGRHSTAHTYTEYHHCACGVSLHARWTIRPKIEMNKKNHAATTMLSWQKTRRKNIICTPCRFLFSIYTVATNWMGTSDVPCKMK